MIMLLLSPNLNFILYNNLSIRREWERSLFHTFTTHSSSAIYTHPKAIIMAHPIYIRQRAGPLGPPVTLLTSQNSSFVKVISDKELVKAHVGNNFTACWVAK